MNKLLKKTKITETIQEKKSEKTKTKESELSTKITIYKEKAR